MNQCNTNLKSDINPLSYERLRISHLCQLKNLHKLENIGQ